VKWVLIFINFFIIISKHGVGFAHQSPFKIMPNTFTNLCKLFNLCFCIRNNFSVFWGADSQEMMRRSFELGTQLGGHRRTKEVLAWLRKRRRNLMREDVVSFVSGRPAAPARPQTHGRSSFSRAAGRYASFEPSSPRCSPSSRAGVFYPGETSAGMNGFKDLPNFQGQTLFVDGFPSFRVFWMKSVWMN